MAVIHGKYFSGGVVIENPGAGPVQGREEASLRNAVANMEALVLDLEERLRAGGLASFEAMTDPAQAEAGQLMGGTQHSATPDGRYAFRLFVDGASHVVEMPGMPLAEVRFLKAAGQNVWDFPRLYIDGSSWLWLHGLNVLADSGREHGRPLRG